jgi:8-oxo-dGTP diphosphatase
MINVTCAVIRNEDNQVLVVQRGSNSDHPFRWEFPGGKLLDSETEEVCIIREIREELAVDIVICGRLPEVEYDYGHKQIRLIPFICDTLDDLPVLTEHIAFKWLEPAALGSVDFSEADIPVAESYMRISAGSPCNERRQIMNTEAKVPDDDTELRTMVIALMSTKEAELVAASAAENHSVLMKLLEFSRSQDKKLAFHSSWILTKTCDMFPDIIHPHLSGIVEILDKLDNESSLRSFLRIISLSDLNKIDSGQHGTLAEICFNLLRSSLSAVAIKAYSMEILYQLTIIYPGLANELSETLRIMMEDGSAGITSRGRMILKKLDLPDGKM